MNWPAMDEGGLLRLVRRLPEGPARADMESRAWCLARVGVKSEASSRERKREERRDSSSSSWKLGEVRYFAERERVPIGWGMGGKVCVSYGRGGALNAGGVSVQKRVGGWAQTDIISLIQRVRKNLPNSRRSPRPWWSTPLTCSRMIMFPFL